jgi:hypothetical protein
MRRAADRRQCADSCKWRSAACVESIVEVTWPLNEDGSRLPIVDQLPQQSGRCGAMVPHREEDDFSIKAIEGSMIDLTGSQRVIHIYYNNGKMANQFPDI